MLVALNRWVWDRATSCYFRKAEPVEAYMQARQELQRHLAHGHVGV